MPLDGDTPAAGKAAGGEGYGRVDTVGMAPWSRVWPGEGGGGDA